MSQHLEGKTTLVRWNNLSRISKMDLLNRKNRAQILKSCRPIRKHAPHAMPYVYPACPEGIAFFLIIRLPCSIHAVRSVTHLTGVLIRKTKKTTLALFAPLAGEALAKTGSRFRKLTKLPTSPEVPCSPAQRSERFQQKKEKLIN